MSYELIEDILIILGLCLMAVSMFKYYQRTQDKSLFKKIWFQKLNLSKNEYVLNRAGLYIIIMGIIIRFMNGFMA